MIYEIGIFEITDPLPNIYAIEGMITTSIPSFIR